MFQKFGQDVPQSLIDAVSNIMEAKDDEPAKPDADAIARRKRLQALKDKAEDDAAEHGYEKEKSSVRKIAGKAYGGAKQKDEPEQQDEAYKNSGGGSYHNPHKDLNKSGFSWTTKEKEKEKESKQKNEELKGNQHKIDANKNGKIDADDFKKLRAGKKDEGCDCKEETQITEKSVSKAQQKFMGMVYAAKKGGKAASPEVAKAASGMSKKAAHDYAATKTKGLPQHKEETDPKDLPFTPDKPHAPIAKAGKSGYGPSAAKHLARQGLKKFLKKETLMGKAGCTSEETDLEESRGHKILATKLRQLNAKIDKMSSGIAPDTHTNPQSTKDKFKDAENIKKVEIVTQKDTSVKKEETVNEISSKTLGSYINKAVVDSQRHKENSKLAMKDYEDKGGQGSGYDRAEKHDAKSAKRVAGVKQAFSKLEKEEVELTEGLQFGGNIDNHINSLGHGKIGFVMQQNKDNLVAVHHQEGNKHHLAIFHKGNLAHQSTHDNFETASGHAHSALTTKKGMKALNLKEEVQIDETATLDQYIKSMGYDPEHMEKNKKVMFSKTNAFKQWAQRQESLYDAGQKGTQDIDTHMSSGATARG